jgi:hypothetical protein
MGSEASGQMGPRAPFEAEQQCLVREANEVAEHVNSVLRGGDPRAALRCECGDPACQAHVQLTHAEYEAVRAYGSRFLINLNHEDPENTWVLSENARFAVIDVVAGDVRHQVRSRNPRHAWVDARDRSTR